MTLRLTQAQRRKEPFFFYPLNIYKIASGLNFMTLCFSWEEARTPEWCEVERFCPHWLHNPII